MDKRKLSRIAEETGGRAFFPRKAEELAAIYAGIEAELRSQVLIAYQSTSTRNDPGFRVVDLEGEPVGAGGEDDPGVLPVKSPHHPGPLLPASPLPDGRRGRKVKDS